MTGASTDPPAPSDGTWPPSTDGRGRGRADLADLAGRFGFLLHAAGVPVTPERAGRFATALDLATPGTRQELYWAARVTLVSDHGQVATFDRVFSQVFGGMVDPADERGDPNAPPPTNVHASDPRPRTRGGEGAISPEPSANPTSDDAGGDTEEGDETVLAAFSAEERLRVKDFATLTPDELATMRALLRAVALAPPPRRARRDVRHRHGDRLDLRATLARAHRSGGDPIDRVQRRHRTRPRRLVLICDVSGSMEPYARTYLQLLHSAVAGAGAEAFVFATRLTRLTRALRIRHPDLALRQAGLAAQDWSGGTRIGEALKAFNDEHGRRGMARGAVVVIVSDGWERDDPTLVGQQMERLARLAHRIVWVNPRKASPRYEPLAGGMAQALPHVDRFVSGHSLAAIDEVVAAIRGSV